MKTEKEIKEKLDMLMQTGANSKRQEDMITAQISILCWILGLSK